MALDPEILYRKKFGKPFPYHKVASRPKIKMNKHTKQIIAICALSLAIAVQAFFIVAERAPEEQISAETAQHSAVFKQPLRRLNPERTLRPDGQTESAEILNHWELEGEVHDFPSELYHRPFTVDSRYLAPTVGTANLILKRAFRKLEDVYVAQAYDCDDNAHELMMLLRKEALIEYREYPAALAVGFVGVRIDERIPDYKNMTDDPDEYPMYHAMVVMRVKGGRWYLIEPLSHQVTEFTGTIYEGKVTLHLIYF